MTDDDIAPRLKRLQKALKQHPHNVELHTVAASAYEQLDRPADALPHLAFLLKHTGLPDEALYARYVRSLQRTNNLGQALRVTDEGLRHFPHSRSLVTLKALTLTLMKDIPAACELYQQMYAANPNDYDSVGMCGTLKLLMSDLRDGYVEYARRPLETTNLALLASLPRWSGEPLTGKSVFLWPEQGVGDIVMFLGLLPWVMAQGPRASIILPEKLASLVTRSFPELSVLTAVNATTLSEGAFDYHIPLGDLLLHALPHHAPCDHPPYLRVDTQRAGRLRQAYLERAARHGRAKLIGLSWHTTNATVGFTRIITLDELQPVLSVQGLQFLSLQYGAHADDIAACNRRIPDIIFTDATIDAFDDLDGLAAQMAAMDAIITIDNATVHLAGAIGIPTTLLLAAVPDWRWGLSASSCRWYSSVTAVRQEALGRWHPVVKHVRSQLMGISSSAA